MSLVNEWDDKKNTMNAAIQLTVGSSMNLNWQAQRVESPRYLLSEYGSKAKLSNISESNTKAVILAVWLLEQVNWSNS